MPICQPIAAGRKQRALLFPAARPAAARASATAHRSARHPAAGNIAVRPEAPTRVVVAATAGLSAAPPRASRLCSRRRIARNGTAAACAPNAQAAAAPPTALPSFLPAWGPAFGHGHSASASSGSASAAVAPAELAPANLPVPVRQPRFYVGLVAAPDVSTVGFFRMEKPLPNVGVVLEYRLTNRLRVSTGLLRSTKQYMARREDYDWGAYAKPVYAPQF